MVLEKLFASLLNTVLAEFIEPGNLSQENLQIGVWSGYVVLEQLVLKKNLFDRSKTPLSLNYGVIGRLELRIPWKNIGYEPVILVLDEVLMLVQPKYEWDDVKVRNVREQALKQAKLTASAFFSSKRDSAESTGYTSYGEMMRGYLLDTIMRKMVDNFEVHVKSVHIRYEDCVSCPTDFSFGISIESISMTTRSPDVDVTEKNKSSKGSSNAKSLLEASIQPTGGEVFRKDIEINNFAVYWNPIIPDTMDACTSMFLNRADADIQRLMLRTLVYGCQELIDQPRHHFLFEPHDIYVESDIIFYKATVSTQANITITVKDVNFTFEDRVFREIIALSANMSSFMQLEEFSLYRPKETVFEDPKAWWRYAISAAIHQVQRRREKVSWTQMSQRRDDKYVYIELWKCKVMGLKSGTRPAVKGVKKVKTTKLEHLYGPADPSGATADVSSCYVDIMALSKLRRAPIEALYQPGEFVIPRGRDFSAVQTAFINSTKANIISVCYYAMNEELLALLKDLEERLSYEDISFFRSLAERDLAIEGRSPQTWLGGLSSWIFGGWQSATPADMITDEDRRRLYESLHFDPEAVFAASGGDGHDVSAREANQPSRMIASVSYNINRMGVSLALSAPQSKYISYAGHMTPFLEVELKAIHVDVTVMGTGVPGATHSVTNMSIGDFEAFEVLHNDAMDESSYGYFTKSSGGPHSANSGRRAGKQYIKLVSRKGKELQRRKQQRERAASIASNRTPSKVFTEEISLDKSSASDLRTSTPLVNICIENDASMKDLVDVYVNITVEELELFISPTQKLPQFLNTFFAWPADLEFWSEMEMAAINEIADFQYVLSCKMDYMRRNHMNIEIMGNIRAPVLIITETIPLKSKVDVDGHEDLLNEDFNGESGYLIVDLGHISINTEKLAKAAYEMSLVDHSIREMSIVSGTEAEPPSLFSGNVQRTAAIDKHRKVSASGAKSERVGVRTGQFFRQQGLLSTPLSTKVLIYDEEKDSLPVPPIINDKFNAMLSAAKVQTPTGGLSTSAPRPLQSILNDVIKSEEIEHPDDLPFNHGSENVEVMDDAVSVSGVNNTSVNDRVHRQDSLYDIFTVSIIDCSVYMIQSLSELAEPMHIDKFKKCCIIDRYDMNMSIHVSVLQWDKDLPPLKLEVQLPGIHILLSEEKILRMVSIINAVTENSKRIIDGQKGILSKIEMVKERMRVSASSTDLILSQGYFVRTGGTQMLHRISQKDIFAEDAELRKNVVSGARDVVINCLDAALGPQHALTMRERVNSDFDEELGVQFYDASPGVRSRSTTADEKEYLPSVHIPLSEACLVPSVVSISELPKKGSFYRNQNHSSASRLSKLAGPALYRQGGDSLEADSADSQAVASVKNNNFIVSKTESVRSSKFFSATVWDGNRDADGAVALGESQYGTFIDSVDVKSEYEGNVDYQDDNFSDIGSDDSFQSVMEHEMTAEEAKALAESVHLSLQQREVMVAHMMQEMRLIESDISKQATSRFKSLQKEMRQLEVEVQHLRVSYVETLIRADEMKRREVSRHASSQITEEIGDNSMSIAATAGASTVGSLNAPMIETRRRTLSVGALPHQEVIESLSQPSENFRSNLVNKRTLLQNSVFRPLPDSHRRRFVGVRGGVGGNKELVRLTLEMNTITVDFLCSKAPVVSCAMDLGRDMSGTPSAGETKYAPRSDGSRNSVTPNDFSPNIYSPSIFSSYDDSPMLSNLSGMSPTIENDIPNTSLLRLQISGVKTSLKHKTDDSKISFSVQDMCVEDLFQTMRISNAKLAAVSENQLVDESIERALFIFTDTHLHSNGVSKYSRPRGFSMDPGQLVKLETKIVYGKETTIGEHGLCVDRSSRAFSSYQDGTAVADRQTVMYPTSAKISVALGYLGINIDQNILSHLYRTILSISAQLQDGVDNKVDCVDSAIENDSNPLNWNAPSLERKCSTDSSEVDAAAKSPSKTPVSKDSMPNPVERNYFASVATLKVSAQAAGFSVSIMHKLKPILNTAVWGITTSARRYGDESIELKIRVVDINAHYLRYKAQPSSGLLRHSLATTNQNVDIFYKEPIFGRPAESVAPALHISVSGAEVISESRQSSPKLRLSCLVECTPLDVVLVPKAIMKLVDSVSTGPFVAMLQSSRAPTVSVQTKGSNRPLLMPLNRAMVSLFDKVEGNMNFSSSGLSIFILSQYIRAVSVSPGNSDPVGNQMALEIGKCSFDCAFGGECEFGGIEICQSIMDISLIVDHQVLVEPFDVSLHVAILQDTESSNYYFVPDRANSVFQSQWRPVLIDSISGGQMLSSLAISPIKINIHEGIIIASHNFFDKNIEHIKKMGDKKPMSSGPPEPFPSIEGAGSPVSFWDTNLGFRIGLAMLLYEITVSLQAVSVVPGVLRKETPKVKFRRKMSKKTSSSTTAAQFSDVGSNWWREKPSLQGQISPVPIMSMTMKELRSDVILRHNECSTYNFEASPFLLLKSMIRSFDVCHLKAPSNSMCRILATVSHHDVCSNDILQPTVSIHSTSGFSQYFIDDIPFQFESPDRFLIFSDSRISAAGDISVAVQISNAQFVLLTDALFTFSSLALLYKTSLSDSSSMRYVREMAAHLPTDTMVGLNQKNFFENLVPSERGSAVAAEIIVPESVLTTTYPVSRPLSATGLTSDVNLCNGPVINKIECRDKNRTFLLDRNSFSLPGGIKSICFRISTTGCGGYFPGSDMSSAVPGLYASANARCEVKYIPINWGDDSWDNADTASRATRIKSEVSSDSASLEVNQFDDSIFGAEACHCCWSTTLKFTETQLTLQGIAFPELYAPVVAQHAYISAKSSYDDVFVSTLNSRVPDYKSTSSVANNMVGDKRVTIVKPFSVDIMHTVLIFPFRESHGVVCHQNSVVATEEPGNCSRYSEMLLTCTIPQLKHKLDVNVHGVEVFGFVDYRPFVRIFKNCIKPLMDIHGFVAVAAFDNKESHSANQTTALLLKSGMAASPERHFTSPRKNSKPSGSLANVEEKSSAPESSDNIARIQSIFELLAQIHKISNCAVSLSVADLSLTVVNDTYHEPVSVFKIFQESIIIAVLVDKRSITSSFVETSGGCDFYFEILSEHEHLSAPKSHIISLSCLMRSHVEFHNYTLGAWEPLVEPFEVIVHAKIPLVGNNYDIGSENQLGASVGIPRVDSVWRLDMGTKYAGFINCIAQTQWDTIYENYSSCVYDHVFKSDDTGDGSIRLKVSIPSVVNLNVTSSLLDTIQGTVDEVQRISSEIAYDSYRVMNPKALIGSTSCLTDVENLAPEIESQSDAEKPEDISLVTIRNDTGMVLRIWATLDLTVGEVVVDVPANTSCPLNVSICAHPSDSIDCSVDSSRCISITVLKGSTSSDGSMLTYSKIKNLQLEGDGCRLFLVESSSRSTDRDINFELSGRKLLKDAANSSSIGEFLKPNALCLVTELISHRGVRTLLVRSTMFLYNALGTAVRVTLLKPASEIGVKEAFWTVVIEANSGTSIPAQYCNVNNAGLDIQPLGSTISRRIGSVNIDAPQFPDQVGDQHNDESTNKNAEFYSSIDRNREKRRLQRLKKTSNSPEVLSYAHWINFQVETTASLHDISSNMKMCFDNAVVSIISSGPPPNLQLKYSDSFLSRTITLLPTVVLSNCLAYGIEVAVVLDDPAGTSNVICAQSLDFLLHSGAGNDFSSPSKSFTSYLAAGDSVSTTEFHSSENLILCFRMQNASIANSSWSSTVKISGCSNESNSVKVIEEAEIIFENESSLFVSIEILDTNGVREISVFVPYWLITASDYPIVFQHDTADKAVSEKRLNGVDELCADQFYFNNEYISTPISGEEVKKQGRSRLQGKKSAFKLGPNFPSGGLLDALPVKVGPRNKTSAKHPLRPNQAIWNSMQSLDGDSEIWNLFDLESSYKLVQFSHSRMEGEMDGSHSGHVRLSVNGTSWSRSVNLDRLSTTYVEVLSERSRFRSWLATVRSRAAKRSRAEEESSDVKKDDMTYGALEDESNSQNRAYSFGMTSILAEYPFHRTKLVMVVDQFVLLNNTGQSLQVMQSDSHIVSSVLSFGSIAMSWNSHIPRFLQVRLDQTGWKWSGGFDPMKEGDTSLRLRNEHDSTVYFILVHVVKKGPRVFIALKGGEKMATYRIENHTIRKIKLQQLDVDSVSTTLLQYHTCMYSWDEPLKEQKFKLEIDISDNSTRWVTMGIYSFDKLMTYPRVGEFNVRVVAKGPLRVLQIYPASNFDSEFGEPVVDIDGGEAGEVERDIFKQLAMSDIKLSVEIQMSDIGISIIDKTPEELLYISISDVVIKHEILSGADLLRLNIGSLHVDNQLLSTPFPSMFSPVASLTLSGKKMGTYTLPRSDSETVLMNCSSLKAVTELDNYVGEINILAADNPFVSLTVQRDFSYPGIFFFPLIKFDILPFDINVESTIIGKIVSAVGTLMKENIERERQQREHPVLARTGLLSSSRDRLMGFYPSSIISTRPMKCIQVKNSAIYNEFVTPITVSRATSGDLRLHNCRSSMTHSLHRMCFGDVSMWRPEFLLSFVTQKALRELSPPADEVMKSTTKIYIGRLEISAVRMNMSFNPGIFQGHNLDENTLGMNILSGLLRGVGSTMAVDSVPLTFRNIDLSHIYGSASTVGKTVSNKYTVQAVVQGLLVMLSLEAIGNPVHLVKTIWEGVYDFVSFPLQGIVKSPVEFINGLMKGSESLVFRLVSTFANTVNRVANNSRNVMLVLGVVSNSDVYCLPKGEDKSEPHNYRGNLVSAPKTELEQSGHLVLGASNATPVNLPGNILQGIMKGMSGLLQFPYNGFRRMGIKGMLFGLVRGCLELFTKPLFGGLTGVSYFMSKCQNWFSFRINLGHRRRLQRIRPPRILEPFGNPLNSYRFEDFIGPELLYRACSGQYRFERYICHYFLIADDWRHLDASDNAVRTTIILVTENRILILGGDPADYSELKWNCPLDNVASLSRDSTCADLLKMFYSNSTVRNTNVMPLHLDDEANSVLLVTSLRFMSGKDCSDFITSIFSVRPELRTALFAGLFAAKWCKSRTPSSLRDATGS